MSNTVQAVLEQALFQLTKEQVVTVCAGRTDAGVHALAQVVHLDLSCSWDTYRLVAGLNFYLKNTGLAVIRAYPCSLHARFDAKERFYIYRILNRLSFSPLLQDRVWHIPYPIDVNLMQLASLLFEGEHNFNAFRSSACESKRPVRTINTAKVLQSTDLDLATIDLIFSAPAFLHNQIRIMVGTLVAVGLGKMNSTQITKALHTGHRLEAGPTAPAYGLYFMKVHYEQMA